MIKYKFSHIVYVAIFIGGCMKVIKENIFFYISLLCVFVLSAYAGLSDYDFYWQVDLGRAILTEGNFTQYHNQLWGSTGIYEYYDH